MLKPTSIALICLIASIASISKLIALLDDSSEVVAKRQIEDVISDSLKDALLSKSMLCCKKSVLSCY